MDELEYVRQFPFKFERGPLLFEIHVCDSEEHPAHLYLRARRESDQVMELQNLAHGLADVLFAAAHLVSHSLPYGWGMAGYTMEYRKKFILMRLTQQSGSVH